MTVEKMEQVHLMETCVSIEYLEDNSNVNFEVYVTGDDPASKYISDTDSEGKREEGGLETSLDKRLVQLFTLVIEKKWARVFALVEQDNDVAELTFKSSIPSNHENNMLLHHVCKNNAPKEVIECVLKANNNAASMPGSGGFLPLHYACAFGAPISVVEMLLDEHPGAVKVKEGRKSRLPLHLAARREDPATAEVIVLLMSYYPEATIALDGNGFRPIDYAVKAIGKNKKTQWENIAVLEMGQKWIRVGQNVTLRLEEDFAERLRALEKDFGSYVESLKVVHDEEVARIANDLLDAEFDRELMAEELKLGKQELDEMDTVLQAKLDAMKDKYDRFLSLQEELRLERRELQTPDNETEALLTPAQVDETELAVTIESKSKRITELEEELAESLRMQELTSLGNKPPTETEAKLLSKITALEKAERIKAGVIRRISAMAQEQKRKSQSHVIELVSVINEQQHQINALVSKLDFCEEQINVLKERLPA